MMCGAGQGKMIVDMINIVSLQTYIGAVQSSMPRLMASITGQQSWVLFLANVNVHRHWVTQSWVNMSSWRDFEKALLKGTEGGGHGIGGSGHGSSVGQFEGFMCCSVFLAALYQSSGEALDRQT